MSDITLDLLRQVTSGNRELSMLSGDEYQQLVFERLVEIFLSDPSVLSLEDHKRGEVDYIVREAASTGMLAKRKGRLHYFECKNYSRSLELDNVAKIMVVAVAKQPASIHVVSRTRLQPQVWNYASRLFDTGADGSAIFQNTEFRHWQTNHLLDFIETTANEGDQQSVGEQAFEIAWWLTECLPFSEAEISSSYSADRRIIVSKGRLLHLAVALLKSPESAGLTGLPDKSWVRIVETVKGDSPETLRFRIDTNKLDEGKSYQVSVGAVVGVVNQRIQIGTLCANASTSLLPELRGEEVDTFFQKIGPSGKYRLALIDGEAGAGKTHLIERVAEELRSKCDFDVLCFTVTDDNQNDLLPRLLRDCLTPSIDRASFKGVALAVQHALNSDEFDTRRLDSNIDLLSRIASRMGNRIIVLRDCQYLTEQTTNQLWTLIVALNDSSWGGLRLFIEYRQPEAASNPALMALIKKIHITIRSVVFSKTIAPLTSRQLSALSGDIFISITSEIIDCLIRRTGGLPLFIDTYLQRLLDLGFICRDAQASPLFRIDKPAQLLADALPQDGQSILEERIRHWLYAEFGADADTIAVELGLLAIGEEASDQECIRKALSMPMERLNVICCALLRGNLSLGSLNDKIIFRHDLFRGAVISVAKSAVTFSVRARGVAENIGQEFDDYIVQKRSLRTRLYELLEDNRALEAELRLGVEVAYKASDYRHLIAFLSKLLALLPVDSNIEERYDFKMLFAWALWESDSLLVARDRYIEVAEEAEENNSGDFSIAEAVATDAYRRAIGIDLELMEAVRFLTNAIAVLNRRQTASTFSSIIDRLVLFCAQFGFPQAGHQFFEMGLNYIGGGGAVLCSEAGGLYVNSDPDIALSLFQQSLALTADDLSQHLHSELNILVLEALHKGLELDLSAFSRVWKIASDRGQSEVLTRASLLRGSLFLRAEDWKNARIWIERTATMVTLYHRRDFQLSILNDQLLLSIFNGNPKDSSKYLIAYAQIFEEITTGYEKLLPLVERAYEACNNASKRLPVDMSIILKPSQQPLHCNPFAGMWANIAWSAKEIGEEEISKRFETRPSWLTSDLATSPNRQVRLNGQGLALGAR